MVGKGRVGGIAFLVLLKGHQGAAQLIVAQTGQSANVGGVMRQARCTLLRQLPSRACPTVPNAPGQAGRPTHFCVCRLPNVVAVPVPMYTNRQVAVSSASANLRDTLSRMAAGLRQVTGGDRVRIPIASAAE